MSISDSASGITIDCPNCPQLSSSENLAYKAAELYAALSGISPAWHIRLEKNVPLSAGLGGGSADAGAVLLLLNRRYNAMSREKLAETAFRIGADVPFFLERKHAWVTGAGENIRILPEFADMPDILVVNPGFPASAKWAYSHLKKELIGADDPNIAEKFCRADISWQDFCINDLAAAIMEKFPILEIISAELYSLGAEVVQMSGSGPSLFAVFRDRKAAAAAESMRSRFSGTNGLRIFAAGREF